MFCILLVLASHRGLENLVDNVGFRAQGVYNLEKSKDEPCRYAWRVGGVMGYVKVKV